MTETGPNPEQPTPADPSDEIAVDAAATGEADSSESVGGERHSSDPRPEVAGTTKDGPDRRRQGRLPLDDVTCSLGRILDLSAGGMRIECRKRYSGRVAADLIDQEGHIMVWTTVAWIKRRGLFKFEIGFVFEDIDGTIAKRLTKLAMTHRYRRVI